MCRKMDKARTRIGITVQEHNAQFSQHILTAQLQDEREFNACQNNGTVYYSTLKAPIASKSSAFLVCRNV